MLEESRSLEKKVHLASEAQKAAKDVEQDYAEVNDSWRYLIGSQGLSLPQRPIKEGGAVQEMFLVIRKHFACITKM